MSGPYRESPASPYRTPGRPSYPCPRCEAGLAAAELAGVRFDACDRCTGSFVATETLREVVEQTALCDELRALLPRSANEWAERGRVYVKCPVCETLMNRRQYASGAKVVIDWCRHHGVWFDAGELARVLDFVADGGLARAAARAADEAKAEAQRDHAARMLERMRQPNMTGWGNQRTDKNLGEWLASILWAFK
jgi:Zn-finger nucleic acid-binding protein